MRAAGVRASAGTLETTGSALDIRPRSVQLSALAREGDAVLVRVYNAVAHPVEATITLGAPLHATRATLVGILDDELGALDLDGATVTLPLRAWEIATIALR
jgi:hypothetical protein